MNYLLVLNTFMKMHGYIFHVLAGFLRLRLLILVEKMILKVIYIKLDIELIDKSRFLEKCSICNKSGYGPTIKCENCKNN